MALPYFLTPPSPPYLTNPDEVHVAIGSFKVGNTPDTNGIPNNPESSFPIERYTFSSRFQRGPPHPSL